MRLHVSRMMVKDMVTIIWRKMLLYKKRGAIIQLSFSVPGTGGNERDDKIMSHNFRHEITLKTKRKFFLLISDVVHLHNHKMFAHTRHKTWYNFPLLGARQPSFFTSQPCDLAGCRRRFTMLESHFILFISHLQNWFRISSSRLNWRKKKKHYTCGALFDSYSCDGNYKR